MKMMQQIFERVSNDAITKLDISINEQRVYSTLITIGRLPVWALRNQVYQP
jgi:hypothetical protein